MITQPNSVPERLLAVTALGAGGLMIGLITTLALEEISPAYLLIACAGLLAFLPTLAMREPKRYWLFLLFVSVPIDLYKRVTGFIEDPWTLLQKYGLPPVETLSVDIYLTDIVQFAMVVPWLAGIVSKRERFYFPRVALIYVAFLAYSLVNAMIVSPSFYLSIFEWCRQLLYLISFLYIVNNVLTPRQLRAVLAGIMFGLAIEIAAVGTLFYLQIGTEKPIFSVVYSRNADDIKVHEHTHFEGESGAGTHIKRSPGTFGHPALAAYYLEFLLPVALGLMLIAKTVRDRLLYGALFAGGCVALYLTFARSGLVGFICGSVAFLFLSGWSGLVSRRMFGWFVLLFAIAAGIGAPIVIAVLLSRPEAAQFRLGLVDKGLHNFWERPIFGSGLNNASAVMEGARRVLPNGTRTNLEKLHVHYLAVLVESGLVGFLLFFSFFGAIAAMALRHMVKARDEVKVVLVAIVAAMADIAVHNFGDPFQGHAPSAMLWMYSGLVVAVCRQFEAERVVAGLRRRFVGGGAAVAAGE